MGPIALTLEVVLEKREVSAPVDSEKYEGKGGEYDGEKGKAKKGERGGNDDGEEEIATREEGDAGGQGGEASGEMDGQGGGERSEGENWVCEQEAGQSSDDQGKPSE
ncbi:hypothetical protein EX30DRAFT_344386 [Ascodesmis nigricans]|uniref:Uncharacterized protein n=1 Tax=Ascodesmis nigricans TaxID=341454 RepID=A0A4S2MJW7_9PEZI|nr:hypothetical protein EX30DRAFT_344386 [Ascodesmis nigricans]